MKCVVPKCYSTKQNSSSAVSFHLPPRNPSVREQWLKFCKLPLNFQERIFICSHHFAAEAFERNCSLQENPEFPRFKRILKKNALPTIRKPVARTSKRRKRQEQENIVNEVLRTADCEFRCGENTAFGSEEVNDLNLTEEEFDGYDVAEMRADSKKCEDFKNNLKLLMPAYFDFDHDDQQSDEDEFLHCSEDMAADHPYASLRNQRPVVKQKEKSLVDKFAAEAAAERYTSNILRQQLKELKEEYTNQQKMFAAAFKEKEKELEQAKENLLQLRSAIQSVQQLGEERVTARVRSELMKYLTSNQVDLLMGIKKRVNWTAQEIALSYTIRYHGKSIWNLLRKEIHYPLPCLQTLNTWSSHIDMTEGILKDVLKLMKILGSKMSDQERVTVITFDEMSVEETVEYDSRHDREVGPFKNIQVMMARGLFGTWKQPIYAAFNTKVTRSILDTVILELHNAGFETELCVSDCGGGNQGLWRECGIDIVKDHTKTSFVHPVTKKTINFMPDAPHLLKLIRNHLLDDGFLYNGKLITKRFLILLIGKASTIPPDDSEENLHSTDYNALFKLTEKHVYCTGSERQNVPLAAELLSHTTAVNLRRHFGQFEEARLLADFIDTVDKWFGLMNSSNLTETLVHKKCFGEALDKQLEILDNMELLMASTRLLRKHQLPALPIVQVFQKCVIMSINSTRQLFHRMKANYGIRFLIMYKTNQDCLENLFGQMRQNGGPNNHPTPLDALNRLRMIILGKGLTQQLTRNQNSQDILIQEDFLITRAFKEAKQFACEESEESSDEEDPECDDQQQQTLTQEEEDGFQYAMGFVARAVNRAEPLKHEPLGSFTYAVPKDQSTDSNNYVIELSCGGLTNPNDNWIKEARRMDNTFNVLLDKNSKIGVPGFKKKYNIKKRALKLLKKKFPHVNDTVIRQFVKTKVNIRISNMKKAIRERKYRKFKTTKKQDDRRSAVTRKNGEKLKQFRSIRLP